MPKESMEKKWVTPIQKEKGEKKTEMGAEERKEYLEEVKKEAGEMGKLVEYGQAEDYREAARMVELEKELDSIIEPDREKFNKKTPYYVERYFTIGDEIKALRKAGRNDLVYRYFEMESTKVDNKLSKGEQLGCRGCFCYDASRLVGFLNEIEESDLPKAIEKNLDLVDKISKAKFETHDDEEGSPDMLRRKIFDTLIIKLEKIKDEKIKKDIIDRILTENQKIVREILTNEDAGNILKEAIIQRNDISDKQKFSYLKKIETNVPDISIECLEKMLDLDVPKGAKSALILRLYEEASREGRKKKGDYLIPSELGINKRLALLKVAAERGFPIPNYGEKIKELIKDTNRINDPVVGRKWAYHSLADIEKTDEEIRKLKGEKRKDLGPGLKLEQAKYSSGTKIYFDGEFIDILVGANFSEKATNGEIVAWTVSEVIDRDTITGTQNRDNVYVWKRGWKKPKIIFEDHAWSSERYFRVFAPEVTPDGKVKIKRIDGEKKKEEEFEVK